MCRARCLEGNSQVGRKYVIRNLVSRIGKSSYYSMGIAVFRIPCFPLFFLSTTLGLFPFLTSSFILLPGGSLGRDGIFIQISLDPSSKFLARPAASKKNGHCIMRVGVVRPALGLMPRLRKFYLLLVLTLPRVGSWSLVNCLNDRYSSNYGEIIDERPRRA